MRFLTVAERELRAAARRRGTYRVRWITAVAFFALLVWLLWAMDGFTRRGAAVEVFRAFSVLSFTYCILIGTAVTADCLSAERREGTLGLLFLTNLNSAEIVAGKFCSTALTAILGLASIFPMLALPMLMGGITLAYFWKTVLALAVTILFSMAAGFVATTICRRQFTAIAFALGMGIAFGAGLLGSVAAVHELRKAVSWTDNLAAFCPLYALVSADGSRTFGVNHYWWSLLAISSVAAVWLMLVTWRLARSWRDQPKGRRAAGLSLRWERWRASGDSGRVALRRRLLNINPFFWLGGRRRISSPVFMLLALILVTTSTLLLAPFFGRTISAGTSAPLVGHLFAWLWTGLAIHLMTAYYAAMVASQRLAEDKETGALELILSTPVSERTMSLGSWMAYGRRMFFPMLLATLVHLFFLWQCLSVTLEEVPGYAGRGLTEWKVFWMALFETPVKGWQPDWQIGFILRCVLLALGLLVLGWITLGWAGRWMGLRMKHPGFAPVVALAWLFLPPTILFSVACYLGDVFKFYQWPARQFAPFMMWLAVAIGVGHCALLAGWARGHLRRDLRAVVMNRFQPPAPTDWRRIIFLTLRRLAIGLAAASAGLVLLVLLFYGYQNWRGQRRWTAFERGLKQRGQSLDLARTLPGPVPDDVNFARSPGFQASLNRTNLFAQLRERLRRQGGLFPVMPNGSVTLEWNSQRFLPLANAASLLSQTSSPALGPRSGPRYYSPSILETNRADIALKVLRSMEPFEEPMSALASGAKRPYFQITTDRDASAVLFPGQPELSLIDGAQGLFLIRACAALELNRNTAAAEDALTSLRLAGLARQSIDAKSTLRAQAMLTASLQPLWEGLVQHRWTEAQLAEMQRLLSEIDFLSDYTNAVPRLVLAHITAWQSQSANNHSTNLILLSAGYGNPRIRQWQPRAWWLEYGIELHQIGEHAVARMDVAAGRVVMQVAWDDLSGLPLDYDTQTLLQQPTWSGANQSLVVFAQNAVNQAVLACALERYLLARGRYPETLEELTPAFLGRIPTDPVRGRPMSYELLDGRHYILRSVGPNEVDDRKNTASDDWLWAFPTNAPAGK